MESQLHKDAKTLVFGQDMDLTHKKEQLPRAGLIFFVGDSICNKMFLKQTKDIYQESSLWIFFRDFSLF